MQKLTTLKTPSSIIVFDKWQEITPPSSIPLEFEPGEYAQFDWRVREAPLLSLNFK